VRPDCVQPLVGLHEGNDAIAYPFYEWVLVLSQTWQVFKTCQVFLWVSIYWSSLPHMEILMHIQTVIDDQLYQQAATLTGLADKQALLEEALRLLIAVKQAPRIPAETVRRKALEHFASVRIAWHGKPIKDRDALYDEVRG